MLHVGNDIGEGNAALLRSAIQQMLVIMRRENVLSFKMLAAAATTDLLFPQYGFHAGAVIHFTLLQRFPDTSMTLTQDHPSEKGLILKFVKPRDIEVVKSMLDEVANIIRGRWEGHQI